MIDLLVEYGFIYEHKKTFDNDVYPCYYSKTENGFVVFIIINKESENIDFAVYDSNKKLITMVHHIGLILKDKESQELFISRAVHVPYNHDLILRTK
ncbi:MAG: hypothetical protein HRT69_18660 [Flavobacteriaceae bacterium]|nr:hypothetical protein [Flavobacteriaceae bacterium]